MSAYTNQNDPAYFPEDPGEWIRAFTAALNALQSPLAQRTPESREHTLPGHGAAEG